MKNLAHCSAVVRQKYKCAANTKNIFTGLLFNSTLKNREGNWSELAFAKTSGIVARNAPLSYWPFFPLYLKTVPEAFPKVHLANFPFVSWVANCNSDSHKDFSCLRQCI